jgi:hypothetical protein
VAEAGLDAVEAACAEALSAKLFGRDVVLNILARQRDADPPRPVATPAALTLAIEPILQRVVVYFHDVAHVRDGSAFRGRTNASSRSGSSPQSELKAPGIVRRGPPN